MISAMASRKSRNIYISKYFMVARNFIHIFVLRYNCERSELLICKVHQFGLGCIKNCARRPIRKPFRDFFYPFRGRYIRYFFNLIFGNSLMTRRMSYLGVVIFGTVLFRGRYIRYSVISHLQPKVIWLTGLGMVGLKIEQKDSACCCTKVCS